MKTQMRFQKILMFASLVTGAIVFVFALGFLSGSLSEVFYYIDQNTGDKINCENFLLTSQSFVTTLVALSIVLIVLAAFMFLTASHSRRNYYITNYIAIGAFLLLALVIVIYMFAMVSVCMNQYVNEITWDALGSTVEQVKTHELSLSYANFIIGYVVAVVVLADAVLLALCTVWKVLLMRGEKQLLAKNRPQEAAPATEEVA